ncbi:MAG: peptide deformylase [Candidatus Eremiobacteraeota bacterium]|nr:peptide deformylase [Candidatus Eremiobacteraeota bacterium]
MSVRRIRVEGDPVLRKQAKKIKKIDSLVLRILDDMAETMYASKITGIGLAAPQVGVPQRLVVVDIGNGLYKMINPVILEREGSVVDYEGCLSCPNIYGEVERAKRVVVKYMDEKGKTHRLEGEDLLARVLQHEVDHLDGRLFIDIAKNLVKHEETGGSETTDSEDSEPPPIWQKF